VAGGPVTAKKIAVTGPTARGSGAGVPSGLFGFFDVVEE
ncbi:uncharacterized protein METZ01_LOCUS240638, partial [marine metagenome]